MTDINAQLSKLYYDPSVGLTSASRFYTKVKQLIPSVTKKQVDAFIKNQETQQVFTRRSVKHYYPLRSYSPLQRLQVDLLDVSSLASANNNIHFLFNAQDVYSKYLFSEPLKSKSADNILEAFKKVVEQIIDMNQFPPLIIDSDKEKGITGRKFTAYCNSLSITQHFKDTNTEMSQIESTNRQIRNLIGRYLASTHSQKYIDALPDLITNFNNSLNRNLKTTPTKALDNNKKYDAYIKRQSAKAKQAAVTGDYDSFEVGETVRLKIRNNIFDKKAGQNKFTKTTHTILGKNGDLYSVSDRDSLYKPYELLRVSKVEKYIPQSKDELAEEEEAISDNKKQRRTVRRINKEGISPAQDIIQDTNSRVLRRFKPRQDLGFQITDY